MANGDNSRGEAPLLQTNRRPAVGAQPPARLQPCGTAQRYRGQGPLLLPGLIDGQARRDGTSDHQIH